MPETRVDFRYTAGVVASAQRTRFIHSQQFKIILFFWLGTFIFLSLHVLLPNVFRILTDITWPIVFLISLVYAVTLLVMIFVTPFIDFLFNRFWHLPLSLNFSEKMLRLTVDQQARKAAAASAGAGAGKKKGAAEKRSGGEAKKPKRKPASLDLEWSEIQQVQANRRAYIIVYGPQSRYFVVPRAAFRSTDQEQRFRDLLGEKLKA